MHGAGLHRRSLSRNGDDRAGSISRRWPAAYLRRALHRRLLPRWSPIRSPGTCRAPAAAEALLLYACVASPLMIGVLIRNFGWMIMVNVDGPLNRALLSLGRHRPAVAASVHAGPASRWRWSMSSRRSWCCRSTTRCATSIRPSLEASRSLGASRFATFWKVILPLELPGDPARFDPGLRAGDGGLRHAGAAGRPDGDDDADAGRADPGRHVRLAARRGAGRRSMATAALIVVVVFSLATHRLDGTGAAHDRRAGDRGRRGSQARR